MRIKEIVQETNIKESTAGATGSSAVATAPTAGANAGTLFGGTFQQRDNPFRKKRKKK